MAFFKDKKKSLHKESPQIISSTLGSKISRCMVVNGDIISCEAIVVDGRVNGDIISNKTIKLNKGCVVFGKIKAKDVIVDGILEGPIEAENIEIGKSAKTQGYMIANTITIAGESDGDILAKSTLIIKKGADVTTLETKSKVVKVLGIIRGNITATELLVIRDNGMVDGDIRSKEYFCSGDSKITGTITRYIDNISNKSNYNYKKIYNKIKEVKRIR